MAGLSIMEIYKRFLLLVLFTFSATVNATLIGDTVSGIANFGTLDDRNFFNSTHGFVPAGACQSDGVGDTATSVVNDPNAACGAEFQFSSNFTGLDVDLLGDIVTVTVTKNDAANLGLDVMNLYLTDLDWTDGPGFIEDIEILNNTFIDLQVTFGPDSLLFHQDRVTTGLDYTASVRLITQHTQVPEPTTLALFGLGLAGLGFTRRRMKT